MPTRDEISRDIRRKLDDSSLPSDTPLHSFVLQAMEDMNHGMADLDDELASLAARLSWLATVPTWTNERPIGEFTGYVEARLSDCEAALVLVRRRWEKHLQEPSPRADPTAS